MVEPSSSTAESEPHKVFPFDCIIVTSPDEASATSCQAPLSRILERRLLQLYPQQNIRIVSTFDSYGARCGSGGGTLAALEFASYGETVLVLHAGGDSSRCPTQMILGKAWTSLPCGQYPNPTVWLIDQIQKLYEQAAFPSGTVIVAATDTLISFFEQDPAKNVPWKLPNDDESVVLGVAVPAVLGTAKNHGVYVLPDELSTMATIGVEYPLDVWQKPPISQLLQSPSTSFAKFNDNTNKYAWIDTGVVIFLPQAVKVLLDLSSGILAKCTRRGLQVAYEKERVPNQTLEDYARKTALKIDLYTDILHNLSWPSQTKSKDETTLRSVLSQVKLKILVAPQGQFLHLGTTQELVEFVTSGAYPPTTHIDAFMPTYDSTTALSAKFSLKPRHQCWPSPPPLQQNVCLQSIFPSGESTIGRLSHIEYCDLGDYDSITIGSGCMISGWRNPTKDTSPLHFPSDISVQQLALVPSDGKLFYAYMVLGTRDQIKAEKNLATIFGLSVTDFLQRTGLTPIDLGWNEEIGDGDNLWNALLHPTVPEGTSFDSVFGWLGKLKSSLDDDNNDDDEVKHDASLLKWKSLPRVSLEQLHNLADAESEWSFRQQLENQIRNLQEENVVPYLRNSLTRYNQEVHCDLQWILEIPNRDTALTNVMKIISALEDIAMEEMRKGQYQICGRAFMIASALLADFANLPAKRTNIVEMENLNVLCYPEIARLRSTSTGKNSFYGRIEVLATIIDNRRSQSRELFLSRLAANSAMMEQLSLSMNELCIASGFQRFDIGSRSHNPPVAMKWVLSMAPARIDLAGGWTDTPPLCYEFGGSVTGVSVLVDNHMPLSCRCRIVPGESGIFIRAESRNCNDGSLNDSCDAIVMDISSLGNFRDPTSNCALVRAALICLGMANEEQIFSNVNLQPLINKFCSSENDVRLDIVSCSLLPQGSGMGTSSILAGCVLASIAKCVGIGDLEEDFLLHAVLMLEQLLTTGGGWQDQANGIVPGIKTVRSHASILPMSIAVERLEVDPEVLVRLEERLMLVFTGMTRLAKNILQDVLRRWARRTFEVVSTVSRNVGLSEACRQALLDGDISTVGRVLLEYCDIKVRMADENSVVMPSHCQYLISELLQNNFIAGASLCGAGGGGFMVMITADGVHKDQVKRLICEKLAATCDDLSYYTFHDCRISCQGLTTTTIEDESVHMDDYRLEWQKYN